MQNSSLAPLGCALFSMALASTLHAQHAQTVLFGEANPDGLGQALEERAVHPLTAPYYHEDSFVTSDVRAWFVYHSFPDNIAIGGGNAKVYALQIRAALTDTLQLVAYKDGYVDFNTGLIDDDGMNDLAAGLKWNFYQDWATNSHAAVGAGYELGIGDEEVLQEDDELRFWASYNKGLERLHLGATVNYMVPVGSEDALGDSDRLSWHLHGDYWVNENFSPVVEVNGYMTTSNGDNVAVQFSGVDVANLGGGDGNDVVTGALGFEYRLNSELAFRGAYESPLTSEEDLFGYRWTGSVVWAF